MDVDGLYILMFLAMGNRKNSPDFCSAFPELQVLRFFIFRFLKTTAVSTSFLFLQFLTSYVLKSLPWQDHLDYIFFLLFSTIHA